MINAPHTLSTVIVTHNVAIYCISAANHFTVAHQVDFFSRNLTKHFDIFFLSFGSEIEREEKNT